MTALRRRRGRSLFGVVSLGVIAIIAIGVATSGCTKRNPDYCCVSRDACKADGFDSLQTCAAGVCVDNACVNDGCSTNSDCGGEAPYCSDNVCVACTEDAHCDAAAPVCDTARHACRLCAADTECASGACDLAVGSCVDVGAILYVAATGTNADRCTVANPCSLQRAAELSDSVHNYIVIGAGRHTSSAVLENKSVTIVGNGALIEAPLTAIKITGSSDVAVRNLVIHANGAETSGIECYDSSHLTLDDIKTQTSIASTDVGCGTGTEATIRQSEFRQPIYLGGKFLGDRLQLLGGITIYGTESASLTNSIIHNKVELYAGSNDRGRADLDNNTFDDAAITGGSTSAISLTSNILHNSTVFSPCINCNYNLMFPDNGLKKPANLVGDPLFKDAHNGDYHLRAGSPAIDAGSPRPSIANGHDYDLASRPQGARLDIGAFEYVPLSSASTF